ncbi:hypothetical protein NS220_07560 [Microbacterium testaceum]|uniref:HTH cro/C1-type domain-containing protein n=1 Tax=Microbacterium testaceum TaxID=2033 RepID=A0A147EXV7_MICTE|nr:DUF2690 domain-containing protein [Microbacterium testaceum]KTR94866.1 hypothetical protein NS220_07560 [Microbacterium testaceum]
MNILAGGDAGSASDVQTHTQPDSVFRFAADLRGLRHSRGNPTLESMAMATRISKSVISEAFVGRRLPTANTVRELSRMFGADTSAWLTRRAALAASSARAPALPSPEPPSRRSRRPALVVIAATVVVAGLIAVGAGSGSSSRPAPSPSAALRDLPVVPPINGADPLQTSCPSDARAIRQTSVADGLFSVTLMYSPRCEAAWAVATAGVADAEGTTVSLRLYPTGDRFGGQARATLDDGAIARTRILTASVISDGVCVEVSLARQGGESIVYDPPLCADPVSAGEGAASIH